jgi:hypothetical protein
MAKPFKDFQKKKYHRKSKFEEEERTCKVRRCVRTIQRNAEREIEYIRIGGDQGR